MAKLTKHTPGPWAYERCSLPDGGINLIGDGKIILQNIRFNDSPGFVDGAMNAALVAAAPDLYAACMALLEHGNQADHTQAMDMAAAAIAKSKGHIK